jgi:hypothetical protein
MNKLIDCRECGRINNAEWTNCRDCSEPLNDVDEVESLEYLDPVHERLGITPTNVGLSLLLLVAVCFTYISFGSNDQVEQQQISGLATQEEESLEPAINAFITGDLAGAQSFIKSLSPMSPSAKKFLKILEDWDSLLGVYTPHRSLEKFDSSLYKPSEKGLVSRVAVSPNQVEIGLENVYSSRVKPDISVRLYNRDGIQIFSHNESWMMDSLSAGEVWSTSERGCAMPLSLVFSRWVLLGGWDEKPFYAWASHDPGEIAVEANTVQNSISNMVKPSRAFESLDYSLSEIIPEVVRYGRTIDTSKLSDVVAGVSFSTAGGCTIHYNNRTPVRIKPDVAIYVFNKDGVILSTLKDSWSFSSLDPGEKDDESVGGTISFPSEEMMFSRWSNVCFDDRPAWVWFAGSQVAVNNMRSRVRPMFDKKRREYLQEMLAEQ